MRHLALRRVLSLALLVAALVACGKKGDPRPPILLVPAPTTDLTVTQRGDQLLLELAYPQTTAAGTPLPGLGGVTVWELAWRAPAGAAGPIETDEARFVAGARPGRVVPAEELASAVAGDRLRLAIEIPESEPGTSGVPVLSLAVKTAGPGGEESIFSNRVTLPLVEPPVPPTGIEAHAEARGVRLRWSHPDLGSAAPASEAAGEGASPEPEPPAEPAPAAGAEGTAGSASETAADETEGGELATPSEPQLAGFNIYRRRATERVYGQPLRALGAQAATFLDESALFGESYIYAVTAVATRHPVVVESELAEEVEVVYRDVFAPPVPADLVALSEGRRVRLVWAASRAPDVAGYRVYRRGPDTQDFQALTAELVTATDFTDRDLAPGATYTYRVTAVDRLGNESRPSASATAAIR